MPESWLSFVLGMVLGAFAMATALQTNAFRNQPFQAFIYFVVLIVLVSVFWLFST